MPYKCRFHCLGYALYALLLGPVLYNYNWVWSPHHLRSLFFSAALLFLFLVPQFASGVFSLFFFFRALDRTPDAASRGIRFAKLPLIILVGEQSPKIIDVMPSR
jgi:hypothetical protein